MAIICDIKIDIIMCEPHCVKIFFCEPPPQSSCSDFLIHDIHISHLVVDDVFTWGMLEVNLLCIFLLESTSARWD